MKIFTLKFKNIENLDLKLEGKLPINRDELIVLANSWGRNDWFYSFDKNRNDIKINICEPKEKFNLSKLDVSEIKDFNDIFKYSNFNGDINSWNISSAINMSHMFAYTKEFNSPLDKWDTSKVKDIECMFAHAIKFNQNLNSWNISNITSIYGIFYKTKEFNQPVLWDLSNVQYCSNIFYETKAFLEKFNNGKTLPNETEEIKEWLIENRPLMEALEIRNNKSNNLDKFLLNINVITSTKLNGLHNNKEIYNENI